MHWTRLIAIFALLLTAACGPDPDVSCTGGICICTIEFRKTDAESPVAFPPGIRRKHQRRELGKGDGDFGVGIGRSDFLSAEIEQVRGIGWQHHGHGHALIRHGDRLGSLFRLDVMPGSRLGRRAGEERDRGGRSASKRSNAQRLQSGFPSRSR